MVCPKYLTSQCNEATKRKNHFAVYRHLDAGAIGIASSSPADKHSHPENDATYDLRQLFIMSEHPNDKSHLYCLCHSHDQHTSDCFLFAHLYFICITTSTITLDIPESPWEYVPGIALPNEVQVYEVSALRAPPAFIA